MKNIQFNVNITNQNLRADGIDKKFDFIDQDHKRMHEALTIQGYACENNASVFEGFGDLIYDWVYRLNDKVICFNKYQWVWDIVKKKEIINVATKLTVVSAI